MSGLKLKKTLFAASVLCVVSLTLVVEIKNLSAEANGGSRDTLRERARASGGQLKLQDLGDQKIFFNDLRDLSRKSSQVIIGTAISNRCRLSSDSKSITTDYLVSVQELLKGDLRPGSSVTISTPGGAVRFDKETLAMVDVPAFRRPVNGRTYLFFLDRGDSEGRHAVLGGFQGLFDVTGAGSPVLASDRRPDSMLFRQYHKMGVEQFLHEVREKVDR